MKKIDGSQSRRKFIKDAIRTVAFGGLVFVGFSLGSRRGSNSGEVRVCAVDLPCRICSKLPGCRLERARNARQECRDSRNLPCARDGGLE